MKKIIALGLLICLFVATTAANADNDSGSYRPGERESLDAIRKIGNPPDSNLSYDDAEAKSLAAIRDLQLPPAAPVQRSLVRDLQTSSKKLARTSVTLLTLCKFMAAFIAGAIFVVVWHRTKRQKEN